MSRLIVRGRYKDTLTNIADGSREERPWQSNQIQDSALEIITERLLQKGEGNAQSIFYDYLPLRYVALGTGVSSSKPVDQTTLENEVERWPLAALNFDFLDTSSQVLSPQQPSPLFRTTITLQAGQGNHTLTEFGLVGGNATDNLNSGVLFNWITHDPITKNATITLQRVVEVSLSIQRD